MDSAFEELVELTHIDPWFLTEMKELADMTRELSQHTLETLPPDLLREAKRSGFSDARIAQAGAGARPQTLRQSAAISGIIPVYKRVDTCAAEFESYTPYLLFDLRRGRRGGADRRTRRSSFSEAVRTGSGRESSSITAAATHPSRSRKKASRRSWSTAIRRRCRRITTPPTVCTSSR